MKAAAVFLDRDDTVISDRGYLSNAEQVQLLPGVAEAIRRWKASGYRVVMVTNQSGVARGLITEEQLENIHARVQELLLAEGAELDRIYYCPYLDGPEAVVSRYRRDSEMRKPRPGMLIQAAEDLDLDLSRCWIVGDSPRDVQAGLAAGCRTVLLSRDDDPSDQIEADYIVATLSQAAAIILNGEAQQSEAQSLATDKGLSSSPAPAAPAQPSPDELLQVLKEIRTSLTQHQRNAAQHDFSLTRLAATLLQIVAVAILLWGMAAFAGEGPSAVQQALLRFVLAGVVQLIALTLFINDRLP